MNKKVILYTLLLTIIVGLTMLGLQPAPMFAQQPAYLQYLPLIFQAEASPPPPSQNTDWYQHAADAQRTSYLPDAIPTPWRWKWAWNGPDNRGGISSGKFRLPRNSQPVVGDGKVYIAGGARGVFALSNADGSVVWNRNNLGSINSTPAYDPATQALFVLSANGTLYKLNAQTGTTLASFSTSSNSNLPLPPAIAQGRIFFSMGSSVYALETSTLSQVWRYEAGSPVDTPPAYSATRNLIIVASRDLYVHAIDNRNGVRKWRVKHTPLQPGDPGSSGSNDYAEVSRGWPVIADQSGIVLIKLRLDAETLWEWNPSLMTNNAAMRQHLQNHPDQKALLAIDLDNGQEAFIAHVPHAGFGDGGYMPMGPMPVIKTFPDGKQIAYVVMRGGPCKQEPCDSRWDSHLGEMMLDDQTLSGLQAGYVRYMQNTFFPSDEQAFLSMAGDQIFAAHWEAGIAHRIQDRSAGRGSGTNPITVSNLPHIATSQDADACGSGFLNTHYCETRLINTRYWPGGFYIYWRQGAVYDQYWSEYAQWVISRDTLYFVSTDGALVALTSGNPQSNAHTHAPIGVQTDAATAQPPRQPKGILPHDKARAWAGSTATVSGTLQYVFNNGKQVLLGFANPHQGSFKILIRKEAWANFPKPPEVLYAVGQTVLVSGKIEWYQGDPVIYVTSPEQIIVQANPSGR